MATWRVIAATDLDDYNVAALMTALRTKGLRDGQADPFAAVMHDRANYVRNRIASRILISETPYAVPPELVSQTCYLIVEAMSTRLSIALELTEDQRTAISRAYKDLDIAGTDRLPISAADDADVPDVQQPGRIVVVTSNTQHWTREKMEGL